MMRPEFAKTTTRATLIGALLSCTLISPALANWATIDFGTHARLGEQITTAKNQLTELTEMRSIMEQQLSVFGDFGVMGDIFGGSAFSNIGSQSDFYSNMQKFAFDPCAINLCTVGDNPVGTTDIEQAREWAEKNFFTNEPLTNAERRDLEEVRRRAVVYAATNGLALANIVHNDLAGAGEEADALEQIVEGSQSLRGDIRANSAIALATYKIEIQKLAMLTAMLNVEASTAMAQTSIFHENGGNEFPDAFIDSDYSGTDATRRTNVTVPQKGSASGGSGFGGGILGALTGGSSNPLGTLLSGSGLGEVASVFGSGDPVGSLMGGISSGAFPALNPEDINLGNVLGDSLSLANNITAQNGIQGFQGALGSMQQGLMKGGVSGNAETILGASQALARSGGNTELASVLDTARGAVTSGDAGRAVSFAESALRDLAGQGTNQQTLGYLRDAISGVQSGSQAPETLVLDAAALLSGYGRDRNAAASEMLRIDPAAANDANLQALIAQALDAIAAHSGRNELHTVADGVRSISNEDLERLREAAAQRAAVEGDALNAPQNTDTGTVFR